jgi:hypothetical protein
MNATVPFSPAQIRLQVTAYEEISLGAVSTPLDATKAGRCWRAVIKTDGGGTLRYRIDGGVPSQTVGTIFYDGEQLELSHDDAVAFLAFRVDAINPILRVNYYAPVIP